MDTEGQGETKPHFYQVLALLEGQGGTGRDTRLRSELRSKPRTQQRALESRMPQNVTRRRPLGDSVDQQSRTLGTASIRTQERSQTATRAEPEEQFLRLQHLWLDSAYRGQDKGKGWVENSLGDSRACRTSAQTRSQRGANGVGRVVGQGRRQSRWAETASPARNSGLAEASGRRN